MLGVTGFHVALFHDVLFTDYDEPGCLPIASAGQSQPSVHAAPKLPKAPAYLKSGRPGWSRASEPVRGLV